MSAIFGLVYFDDRPESSVKSALAKMSGELKEWAPAGFKQGFLGSAGCSKAFSLPLQNDSYQPEPALSENNRNLFLASARLDNADELTTDLGLSAEEKRRAQDAKLLHLSLEKWGLDAADHIFGEWAFINIHNDEKRIEAARDRIGNTSFYYTYNSKIFAFAPTPQALLVLEEVSNEPDEYILACDLLRFSDINKVHRTKWKSIRKLLPAHRLVATKDNITIQRYWSLRNAPNTRYRKKEEYFDEFRTRFEQSVSTRISSANKVATSLSSGLDSGTISSIAAKQLREQNKKLSAFTSVPAYGEENESRGQLLDEWSLSHRVVDMYDNVKHIRVDSKNLSPIRPLREIVDFFGGTLLSPGNAFWIYDMLNRAKEEKSDMFLTGQLGNAGISWSGGMNKVLHDLFSSNILQTLKEIKNAKKSIGVNPKTVIRFYLLRPFYKGLKENLLAIKSPDSLYGSATPVSFDFIHQAGVKKPIKKSNVFGFKNSLMNPFSERLLTIEINSNHTSTAWHKYGAMFGMNVTDPSADVKLLEFCFGIPDSLHTDGLNTRMLIRNSMKEIVPHDILSNRKRGLQSSDLSRRMLQHKDELVAEVENLNKNPAAEYYLDLNGINGSMEMVMSEKGDDLKTHSNKLLTALMFGYFFEKFY